VSDPRAVDPTARDIAEKLAPAYRTMLDAIGAALYQGVTFEDGAAGNSNFGDFPPLRIQGRRCGPLITPCRWRARR